MSGALLVGDLSDAGFAALRTRHFAAALGVDGRVVRVVDWRDDVAGVARSAGPAAVVTAGNHGPTRAALAAVAALGTAGAPPAFWLDVAGDPFAEAQAFAAHSSDPTEAAIEATAVWAAAYARADAFSTVCAPGRFALLGALGLLGRLARFKLGEEPVYVLPCAADFPDEPGPARGAGLHVALLGGFNTWFDDETLLSGLLLAMARAPVRVTIAGGAIEGHHTEGFARFQAGARASSFAERFHFVGWVPHAELRALLAPAQLTICLDRAGPEAELGARTRVLYALHQGLRVLATARSPIVAEAVAASMVEAVPAACEVGSVAAAEALATAILRDRGAPEESARRTWLNERSVTATTGPLRAWATHPKRSAPAPHADVLAALHAERDRLRTELAAMRASPTFKVLNAGVRLLPLRFRR